MVSKLLVRCAVGAALLCAWHVSAFAAPVLQAPGGGSVRALVIGIDKYPSLPAGSQLSGAVADARDFSRVLAAAGAKVQTLTDGAATRWRLISEMDRLLAESKTGDLVIIAYSGHGMQVRPYPQWQGLDTRRTTQIALAGYSRSGKAGHEIVVDREMRAWFTRFDAKGVDVLAVMDACYGGAMREVAAFSGGMKVRQLGGDTDDAVHDSFVSISMSQREARADVKELSHVTFFAGATDTSVVPEMPGIDPANRQAIRGALSYFLARAIEGLGPNGHARAAIQVCYPQRLSSHGRTAVHRV
jgi:Caspase domain